MKEQVIKLGLENLIQLRIICWQTHLEVGSIDVQLKAACSVLTPLADRFLWISESR